MYRPKKNVQKQSWCIAYCLSNIVYSWNDQCSSIPMAPTALQNTSIYADLEKPWATSAIEVWEKITLCLFLLMSAESLCMIRCTLGCGTTNTPAVTLCDTPWSEPVRKNQNLLADSPVVISLQVQSGAEDIEDIFNAGRLLFFFSCWCEEPLSATRENKYQNQSSDHHLRDWSCL